MGDYAPKARLGWEGLETRVSGRRPGVDQWHQNMPKVRSEAAVPLVQTSARNKNIGSRVGDGMRS